MGRHYPELPEALQRFIRAQRIFFVATAAPGGHINLSPKGVDSLRILDPHRILWLNLTGSGNETAAQVQEDPRMTLMFCAFEGPPLIVRVYGQARAIHRRDPDWPELFAHFDPLPGARQLFELDIERVQISCGMGVPLFDYAGERTQLLEWARKKGPEGIERYWAKHNQISLDGRPTHILRKNT